MTPPAALPPADQASRGALVLIATVVGGLALYWLRDILTPLALALFLMVIIDGFSQVLRRKAPALSAQWALAVAIALTVTAFCVTAFLIAGNASSFVGQLMNDTPRLNKVIADMAGHLHVRAPPTVEQLMGQLDITRYAGGIAQGLQGLASHALFTMIYLGFLFAARAGFAHKVDRLFPGADERAGAQRAFRHIGSGIERYLWIQTVTGVMIAVSSAGVLAIAGMPNPVFWGFLILVTSYIPIIGGVIAQFLPPVFALVEFNSYWSAIGIFGGLTAIQFVVGNIIYPRMQGQSLNLDPIVLVLSLSFWGLVWGVPGMFLSTPLTVMVMVVTDQFRGARWVAILLSGDGEPELADGAVREAANPKPDPAAGAEPANQSVTQS